MIAAICSGLVTVPIVATSELVKCRLQMQTKKNTVYKNSLDVLSKVIYDEGTSKIFRGNVATMLREVPGVCGFFGGYYVSKRFWCNYVQPSRLQDCSFAGLLFCGGVAGLGYWALGYPQDIIKTRLQVAKGDQYPKYHRMVPDGGFINCGI